MTKGKPMTEIKTRMTCQHFNRKLAEEIADPELYGYSKSEGAGLPKAGIELLKMDILKALIETDRKAREEVLEAVRNILGHNFVSSNSRLSPHVQKLKPKKSKRSE